jgi:hypothetical protein
VEWSPPGAVERFLDLALLADVEQGRRRREAEPHSCCAQKLAPPHGTGFPFADQALEFLKAPHVLPLSRSRYAIKIAIVVTTRMIVLIALMVGSTPRLTIEYTRSGSVVEPTPATKNVMTKSSKDMVKARSAPATTPGRI